MILLFIINITMDLFNRTLTLDEALQLDSIIDNGNYEPHMILYADMMNKPEFQATEEETQSILNHLKGNNNTTVPNTVNKAPIVDNDTTENKKVTKTYITLPNATIKFHKHKLKQTKTGQDIQARKSG